MDGLMIAIGKPKKKAGPSLADGAFREYMKGKGKGGDEPAGGDGEDVSSAEEAGKAAAEDFAKATKDGDGAAVWAAYKRMAEAYEECSESADEEQSEKDDGEDEGD
jgi:hypothetical protein